MGPEGKVVQYNSYNSYDLQLDCSRGVTIRNHGHLRKLNEPGPTRTSTQPPIAASGDVLLEHLKAYNMT